MFYLVQFASWQGTGSTYSPMEVDVLLRLVCLAEFATLMSSCRSCFDAIPRTDETDFEQRMREMLDRVIAA